MDLTKTFPRSVSDKIAGVVMLARITDKARASRFELLGIDQAEFADKASEFNDAELERWVYDRHVSKKSAGEIQAFNRSFLEHSPEPGSDGEKYFIEMRNGIDPSRTDITTWPQLLDLDEKRDVPRGKAA